MKIYYNTKKNFFLHKNSSYKSLTQKIIQKLTLISDVQELRGIKMYVILLNNLTNSKDI